MATAAAPLTAPQTVLGTAGYMAPEQVRGQRVDYRADVFAFGAVLYEMLSGRRAFAGATAIDMMTAITRDPPAPVEAIADRPLPPGLVRIVDRCLEKSPAARFQSTTDLAFALRRLSRADSRAASAGRRAATGERAAEARPVGRCRRRAPATCSSLVAAAFWRNRLTSITFG